MMGKRKLEGYSLSIEEGVLKISMVSEKNQTDLSRDGKGRDAIFSKRKEVWVEKNPRNSIN